MLSKKIVNRLATDTKELFDFYELKRLRKSKKQKSEDISGLLETAMEDLIEGAIAPKVDHEPDIILEGKPIEIKTTASQRWRGGAYSKRSGHFVFVSWEVDSNNIPSFFIAGIDLEESDWDTVHYDNYYATFYSKKQLFENRDKVKFYHGTLDAYQRGKQTCIKVNTCPILDG